MQQFKEVLKSHAAHVRQRQERVSKYGRTSEEVLPSSALPQYAMFSPGGSSTSSGELRRRAVVTGGDSTTSGTGHGSGSGFGSDSASGVSSQQILRQRRHEDTYQSAQKVEAAIHQVPAYFTVLTE